MFSNKKKLRGGGAIDIPELGSDIYDTDKRDISGIVKDPHFKNALIGILIICLILLYIWERYLLELESTKKMHQNDVTFYMFYIEVLYRYQLVDFLLIPRVC